MDKLSDRDFKNFEQKYREKIKEGLNGYKPKTDSIDKIESRQYQEFKKQWMPKQLTLYEKACSFSEKLLRIQPDPKEAKQTQDAIDICHLNATPSGVKSFSIVGPLFLVIIVALFSFLPVLMNPAADSRSSMFFVVFSVVVGLALYVPLGNLPQFLAINWRMKASNQMVLAVFYVVTYMRHTSNLENAVDFAAEHLPPPLSLDLKKIMWNVETQKYRNIKESLDAYLETWKKDSIEFVEAMHLIESSLYENSESRRLNSLEKSLTLILDETYEKMLHYAHNLQGPLTMLNMLGIVLPILGLVILPLVVSFMEEVKWYHLFAMYNIALPLAVFYLSRSVLRNRPTGYGDTDVSENNPEIRKHRNIIMKFGGTEFLVHPGFVSVMVFIMLFFVGVSPILMHLVVPELDMAIDGEYNFRFVKSPTDCATYVPPDEVMTFSLLGYKCTKNDELMGPFGVGAAVLSLFIPLAFGVSLGLYFKLRSENIIKIRDESKKLEQEFAGALFQLGNRIGDGLPVEIAFAKVSDIMTGTVSGRFFQLVSTNISKLGMSVEEAIFDKKHGALVYYPSSLIESSMKVLVESSKKGPLVASQALINVSEYIKQIHRVDERLKDLMADTISSLQSQISFLSPAISGIVIGITSMITGIIGNLSDNMALLSQDMGSEAAGGAGMGFSMDFFGLGVPTFFFQVIVGIYVVQIIYIMTILVNGIMNGSD
ncbi:MAG: hypothetical protein ACP5NW_02960, partial [Candidatus Woesearchaeota archaeon]